MLKILTVHNHYLNQGGEDEIVKAEKSMLEKHGNQVTLYERFNAEINNFGIFKKIKFVLKDIFWSNETYHQIRQIIKDKRPDIAHFHNTFLLTSPSAYQACYDEGVPIVQTLHNYRFLCPTGLFYRGGDICQECKEYGNHRAIMRRCWQSSYFKTFLLVKIIKVFNDQKIISKCITRFIALSEFSRNLFEQDKLFREKIDVKPNFIEIDPGFSEKSGTYGLFVGALRDYKGVLTLLDAWKKLGNSIELKIIGDGYLRREVTKCAKNNSIEFLGYKSLDEIYQYIKSARFVVLPSDCYENFPRVIVEAFACGVPVITTNHGACGELIEHNQTGLVFEPRNVDDLVNQVKTITSDGSLVRKMKENAREAYVEKYNMEKNYQMLMNIYKSAIAQQK